MKTPSVYVPGPARYPRILVYHEVSSRFQLGITGVSPDRFTEHLRFVENLGLKFAPLRGLSNRSVENSVCLTFDDAYQSFYDVVFPTLKERNIPATLFVITDYVGRTNDWDVTLGLNRRKHLDWTQIRELSTAGVEIGSHTATHRDLTRLSDENRRRELYASQKDLEDQLGMEITSLAVPFGSVNPDVFSAARELGYREICGGVPGLRGTLPGVLPRMPVYRWDGGRALQRKLNFSLWENLRLKGLQFFSHGTRWLQT